ncbi:hypothetical protein BDN67DRAFT_203286 [Paxillus ammoniavirescens]|nr:hypothetical protein BDN67DRAFT_203286 [Paxillus ammoniavirescens]
MSRDHRNMNSKFKATQAYNVDRSHEGFSNHHAAAKSPPTYIPPPRFQNRPLQSRPGSQGFCNSTPRPLSGFIVPCPEDPSSCSEKDLLNAQLKQSVLLELQKPCNANANTQPMPKDCVTDPTPPPCRPPTMQQDNNITVISTPTEQTIHLR